MYLVCLGLGSLILINVSASVYLDHKHHTLTQGKEHISAANDRNELHSTDKKKNHTSLKCHSPWCSMSCSFVDTADFCQKPMETITKGNRSTRQTYYLKPGLGKREAVAYLGNLKEYVKSDLKLSFMSE